MLNTQERIERYIRRTFNPEEIKYCMLYDELCVVLNLARRDSYNAAVLAFMLGKAKGIRRERVRMREARA